MLSDDAKSAVLDTFGRGGLLLLKCCRLGPRKMRCHERPSYLIVVSYLGTNGIITKLVEQANFKYI
jgi:hypothetical protein